MAELTKRPITALASGLCICAPVEVESAIGIKPKLATNTVINTGRSRRRAPGITASPNSDPAWLCEVALEIARQMGDKCNDCSTHTLPSCAPIRPKESARTRTKSVHTSSEGWEA
jgi:hypothetical protein